MWTFEVKGDDGYETKGNHYTYQVIQGLHTSKSCCSISSLQGDSNFPLQSAIDQDGTQLIEISFLYCEFCPLKTNSYSYKDKVRPISTTREKYSQICLRHQYKLCQDKPGANQHTIIIHNIPT